MGNQQSSQYKISKCLYLTVSFDERLQQWKIKFSIKLSQFGNLIEIDNSFDTIYLDKNPVRFNLTNHTSLKLKHIKRIDFFFEDDSSTFQWISMNETDPRTFNILPVARTGNRLRNHPSKYYLYSRIEETTNWLITVYEVRDIDGILQIPDTNIEKTCFSVGCQITDRIMIDTGSMLVPNLEYNASSNEIQLIKRIELGIIYSIMDNYLQAPIIQTMPQLINS